MKRTSKKNTATQPKPAKTDKKKVPKNSFLRQNLKYLFLIFILFYIFSGFYEKTTGNTGFENLKTILQIPAILVGIVSLYFEKTKLNNFITDLFSESEKKNTNRKITNALSRKNIPTTVILLIILGISAFTLFYKLDNFDIFSDEVQVTQGAAGYYHTGEFRQWDFVKKELVGKPYNRAKPHQWIVAQSYNLFGVNTWAARFPSALFGFIFIFLFYFIGKYFVRDKYAALLSVFSFALYYEFLFLGRWARMYALLYPVFLLSFYWSFKFINEKCNCGYFIKIKNKFTEKYFNFNYIYLPFALILLIFGFYIHTNIALIFPIFLIFLLVSIFIFQEEKKYITAFLFASVILLLQILFPYKVNFSQFTFFKVNNSGIYTKALFGYPFNSFINLIFVLTLFFGMFYIKNKNFTKRYLILFISVFIIWILFSFVIKYPPSYRYISFATPFAVLLIVGSNLLIIRVLYGKFLQFFMVFLLLVSSILTFSNHYKSLYIINSYSPAKPSVADKTVVKNFHKGDVIFKHWGPKNYLVGIPEKTKFLSIGGYKGKPFTEVFEDMKTYSSGWLIWHKYNELRLDKNLVDYANLYFKKYAGYGIDKNGEEIFYYNKSMLKPFELFNFQRNIPSANLNTENIYSFVFDLKTNNNTNGDIFYLRNDKRTFLRIFADSKKITVIIPDKDSISINSKKDILNRIYLITKSDKICLKINSQPFICENVKIKSDIVKFQINPQFNGYINNIRIYDFALSNAQINIIRNDKNISEELKAKNKPFRTLFLWKKK